VTVEQTPVRALVTGAAHGIGRAIALALAEAGADVAVHYGHSADEAEKTAAEITALGRRAKTFAGDVRDSTQVNTFVADAVEFLGGLDVLVTNAGHLVGRSPVADMTDEHWHSVIDVNLSSTFYTCRAALSSLAASGGRIVTMASVAAHNGGGPGAVAYGAAKAGVVGFTKALAKEVGRFGIRANAVAPGMIDTDMLAELAAPARKKLLDAIPLRRFGRADEVADLVSFLVSDRAAYITGSVVEVTGGLVV
jgi:3-oxoacyl-[acyl-carrier protein] reductase